MAGRGSGSEATGEKCPRSTAASGGPGGRAASACLRCALWQQFDQHPDSIPRLPTRLRVALVDSDPGAHDFVRQTLKAHAKGWTLDSYRSPDSLLATLDCSSATQHSAPRQHSTSAAIPQANTLPDQPSTLPTMNRRVDAVPSHAPPDIVLMEAQWPGLAGLQHVRKLIARLPHQRTLMFTACADMGTIIASLMAGAVGYLTKPVAPGYLAYSISEAAQGRAVLGGKAQALLIDFACSVGGSRTFRTLSSREREVMLFLLKGARYKDVSTGLGIHEGTVHRHVHDIYRKFGVHTKKDVLLKLVREH